MTAADDARRRALVALVAVACVAVLLLGQAAADSTAPAGGAADTGQMLGRTGDAYLSGLRIFAAQVLWNRLEPQFHGYYSRLHLRDDTFLAPNLRLVLMLDPQFVQAYYDVPWMLADNGRVDEALAVAREGIANNPHSGLLRVAYAQYLFLFKHDAPAAARQGDLAFAPGIQWKDEVELWESLRVMEDIYRKAGEPDRAAKALAVMSALEAKYGGSDKIPGDRDTDALAH